MEQQIYLIEDEEDVKNILNTNLNNDKDINFLCIKSSEIDSKIMNIPALFIINEDYLECNISDILIKLRDTEDNSITPIIVVSSNKDEKHKIDIAKKRAEYYIEKPINPEYFYYIVKNLTALMYNNRTVSPLTGLPGNIQIQAELKRRLKRKEEFYIIYFDLDNFKAYNDVYGFINGDQIIKFTADIIYRNININGNEHDFIGHIGGDDFVAITTSDEIEKICQDIIIEFSDGVSNFYIEDDREKGYLEIPNRKGEVEQFPLTSISIGVTGSKYRNFYNILEIGEAGAQAKKRAKLICGNSYYIDKRRDK